MYLFYYKILYNFLVNIQKEINDNAISNSNSCTKIQNSLIYNVVLKKGLRLVEQIAFVKPRKKWLTR